MAKPSSTSFSSSTSSLVKRRTFTPIVPDCKKKVKREVEEEDEDVRAAERAVKKAAAKKRLAELEVCGSATKCILH
jgi:hypothetical protein